MLFLRGLPIAHASFFFFSACPDRLAPSRLAIALPQLYPIRSYRIISLFHRLGRGLRLAARGQCSAWASSVSGLEQQCSETIQASTKLVLTVHTYIHTCTQCPCSRLLYLRCEPAIDMLQLALTNNTPRPTCTQECMSNGAAESTRA